MYNFNLKTSFLDSIISMSMITDLVELFNLMEPLEKLYERDFCEFEEAEVSAFFDLLDPDYATRKRAFGLLSKYLDFCKRKHIIETSISLDGAFYYHPSDIVDKCVSGPVGLQRYLNLIYTNEDDMTTDNIYRCLYWIAFSGLTEPNLETITCNDVDLDRMQFVVDGNVYPIYREGKKAIAYCKSLTEFNLLRTTYNTNLKRLPGELLLRGIKAYPRVAPLMVEVFKRSKPIIESGKIKDRLTFSDIRRSGIFYRVSEEEASFRPAIINSKQLIIDELHKAGMANPFHMTVDNYVAEYKKWKKAFK